jgi:hypothetical protein
MALSNEDLDSIRAVMREELEAIKLDIKAMKSDLSLLAKINQLDDIRKDSRLRVLYKEDHQEEA